MLRLALLLTLLASTAHGMSGKPYVPECEKVSEFGQFERIQCLYDEKPYITDYPIPVSFVAPKVGDNLKFEIPLHGDATYTVNCINDNFAELGKVKAKHCAGHHPDRNLYEWAFGWWGLFYGMPTNSFRIAQSVEQAKVLYPGRIDWDRGITLSGRSYGGTGSILQSTLIPQYVDVVDADLAHTNFVEGEYLKNPAVQNTWQHPPEPLDISTAMASGKVDHIFYRVRSSSKDHLGRFDPKFIEDCNTYKIGCYVTWDEGNHYPEINHNPNTYPCEYMEWRKDHAKVIFTNSSANVIGSRGHYNEGLCYARFLKFYRDEPDLFRIPLRYQPRIIEKLPMMPDTVTVDVTLRQTKLQGENFAYTFGNQSGYVTAVDGEITIRGLVLDSARNYQGLELRPVAQSIPLVYTRIKAENQPKPGTELLTQGAFQKVTDVALVNSGFQAGASVVLNMMDGSPEIVIHECTVEKKCTAQEARVSPDGKQIAYSVSYSKTLTQVQAWSFPYKLDFYDLQNVHLAEIWLYTIATGEKRRLTTGYIDRQPAWLNNHKLVMSSSRANQHTLKAQYTYHEAADQCIWPCTQLNMHFNTPAMHIWQMDIETGSMWNMTEMEVMALSPTIMSNGDVLFSSFQGYNQNVIGKTPLNEYWICRVQANGADQSCVLNAHGSPTIHANKYLNGENFGNNHAKDEFRGIRCMSEIEKGVVAGVNYYRGNHGGCFGIPYSLSYADPRVEGASKSMNIPAAMQYADRDQWGSGRYVPSTLKSLFPAGQARDEEVKYKRAPDGSRGPAYGKMGYPHPYPVSGQYLATWAQGDCYLGAPKLYPNALKVGCLKVPVLVKVDMVTDPFDPDQVEVLIDDPQYQRWDVVPVTTYQNLFDQPIPTPLPPIDRDNCTLQVVDAREAELYPIPGGKKIDECQSQGCAVQPGTSYHKENIHALTIYEVEPWNERPTKHEQNNLGWRSIAKIAETPIESDGSVYQSVPCGKPILTVATDKAGMVITRNDMTHGVWGDQTCHGCHDAHSEERRALIEGTAEERFAMTLAAKKGPAPYHDPIRVDFKVVEPTIAKCAACHADLSDPAVRNQKTGEIYLYSWFAWDKKLTRPDQSKYVSKFALESPGYLHCLETPEHPTGANAAECSLLGQFIDQGVQL